MLADNLMWKAGIVVGATEQDLEVVDGPIVLKRSVLFLPCLLSKFVCPVFPFKSIFSFVFTFSNQALSAFQLLSAIQPSAL